MLEFPDHQGLRSEQSVAASIERVLDNFTSTAHGHIATASSRSLEESLAQGLTFRGKHSRGDVIIAIAIPSDKVVPENRRVAIENVLSQLPTRTFIVLTVFGPRGQDDLRWLDSLGLTHPKASQVRVLQVERDGFTPVMLDTWLRTALRG